MYCIFFSWLNVTDKQGPDVLTSLGENLKINHMCLQAAVTHCGKRMTEGNPAGANKHQRQA